VRYNEDYGAMLVTATADGITYQFYNAGGLLIDDYTTTKQCAVATPTPTLVPTAPPTDTATPTLVATAPPAATPQPDTSGTTPVPGVASANLTLFDRATDAGKPHRQKPIHWWQPLVVLQ
nr:hypothetical protein [Caldilineaceae bacterium]